MKNTQIKKIYQIDVFFVILIMIVFNLDPKEWPASNFSLYYPPESNHLGHKNRENDHQLQEFLIVKQILLIST